MKAQNGQTRTRTRRGPTPEWAVQKAIVQFLCASRLGTVKRVNVGVAWMGGSNHAWGPKGRPVRFGEKGHSDLVLEFEGSTRCAFIETKRPGWKPPQRPKDTAAASTWRKYRDHLDQVAFLERQRERGHLAFFATSPEDVERELRAAGINLPISTHARRPR